MTMSRHITSSRVSCRASTKNANRTRLKSTTASSPCIDHVGEKSVAFFGAVDSRAYLFLMTVALRSAQRFHPQSGYFVLVPTGRATDWSGLIKRWSGGTADFLEVPASSMQAFGKASEGREESYSRMTFLRMAVPETLLLRGYKFSVNIDPDVICVGPWDMSMMQQVGLIAGRRVGSSARTLEWLQERANAQGGLGQSSAQLRARQAAVAAVLDGSLGITPSNLAAAPELNGGVLVFNNAKMADVGWLRLCRKLYAALHPIIEGDQDLISLVLASNATLPRALLPSIYNYAFRRDRERLPYTVGRRLRHGMFVRFVVNVHFVMDGKPWQRQNLTAYPMWLAAARIYHVLEWWRLALPHATTLTQLALSKDEVAALHDGRGESSPLVGGASWFKGASKLPQMPSDMLAFAIDPHSLLLCRCFLRGLVHDKKAVPVPLLQSDYAAAHGKPAPKSERALFLSFADDVRATRADLLRACGGGGSSGGEKRGKESGDGGGGGGGDASGGRGGNGGGGGDGGGGSDSGAVRVARIVEVSAAEHAACATARLDAAARTRSATKHKNKTHDSEKRAKSGTHATSKHARTKPR